MVANTVQSNVIIRVFTKLQKGAVRNVKNLTRNIGEMGRVSKMNMMEFRGLTNASGQLDTRNKNLTTSMGRLTGRFRLATHGMRGFRMEMLGVMFFGMMLTRTFTGLLRPAMEAFGVFDLWRMMLMVLFLPIMQEIFPYFLDFVNWFIDLPAPIKKAIGLFVLLGIVFGVVLMLIGQFALGIGSIFMTGLLPIFAIALLAIGVLVLGAIALFKIWKTDFLGLRDTVEEIFEGIKLIFKGAFKAIEGAWILFTGLLSGDTDKIKEGFQKLKNGVEDMFMGMVAVIENAFITMTTIVLKMVESLLDTIISYFPDFIQEWYNFAKDIAKSFLRGLRDILPEGALSKIIRVMLFTPFSLIPDILSSGDIDSENILPSVAEGGTFGSSTITNVNNFYGFTDDELDRKVSEAFKKEYDDGTNRGVTK